MDGINRRNFVKAAAAAGAIGGLSASAKDKEPGSSAVANTVLTDDVTKGSIDPIAGKELKVALVGCGGRGSGAAVQAMQVRKGVKLIAMADAFADKVDGSLGRIKKSMKDQVDVPDERKFSGFDAYKKAIDTDCDIVILTTPPHFRPIHLEYAISKGKHVFMEKPVAVDGPGIRSVIKSAEEAKKKNLMLGVGLQRRHQFNYNASIKECQDGAIGDFMYAQVWWNSSGVWTRPRKDDQTEMEYQMRNWYYFNWLCGDHIVEQHIHNLDVINWLKNGYPVKAYGMGGRQVRTGKEHGEIYDHFAVTYEYADGTKMFSQARHIPNCRNIVREIAHGTKGTCDFGRQSITAGDKKWRFRGKNVSGHAYEWVDLINALDRGEIYNEGKYGAMSTMTAILGRMATYYGKEVTMDQALNSELKLSPESYAWDAKPPTTPDKNGRYPVPMPGKNKPF